MELKKIPLHDLHVSLGGKIVPFAGYLMPVRYSGDKEEHNCVRQSVGVFDVSHMGEFVVKGPKALELIQKVTSNDASKLLDGQAQYSCLPNENGGIVDDLIVYRFAEDDYLLVVNASNIEKDWNWINQYNTMGAELENISDDVCLFAVQGPKAEHVLQKITDYDLSTIKYYHFAVNEIGGIKDVIISATGYTGAGGFELYVSKKEAEKLWNEIFRAGISEGIQPIGLGARDTLRLEMGFCLYGNDIDDTTSPIEAGLGWITKFTKPFINSEWLKKQKETGIQQKLVAFEIQDKGIPRKDYEICTKDGVIIGRVTSGTLSPSLDKGIGLGYVTWGYHTEGTSLFIKIREKLIPATIVKLPFIKK